MKEYFHEILRNNRLYQIFLVDSDNAVDFVSQSIPVKTKSQKITTDSNRKPMFTKCDSYNKAQVKEEQEAKTFVIQVKISINFR